MAENLILRAAKNDFATGIKGSIALIVICGIVLGINWKYVYNVVAGPVPFTAALASSPGAREFVSAHGAVVPTGLTQETTLRLLRGIVESQTTTAQYQAMLVEGRLLVIKVPADFAGQTVEGRLVPLPNAVQLAMGTTFKPYPWMVEATIGYRWDFNLFVLAAAPLFLLALVLLGTSIWRAGDVERHPMIARLTSLGAPLDVAGRLDAEIRSAGASDRIGPLVVTPTAIVALQPLLLVMPLRDLAGVGIKTTKGKSGDRHALMFWTSGRRFADSINIELRHARAALERVATRAPHTIVEEVAAFDRRWMQDRAGCEEEAALRRTA